MLDLMLILFKGAVLFIVYVVPVLIVITVPFGIWIKIKTRPKRDYTLAKIEMEEKGYVDVYDESSGRTIRINGWGKEAREKRKQQK